jgi:RNA polymerase sigma factor (sigma-70 family)
VSEPREAAFNEIYRQHSGPVYRYTLYLTRNAAVAEDLTAETFLRVWSSSAPVRVETVRAWLLTIARNLAFARSRHRGREQELTDAAQNLGLDESIDSRRELARVMEAIQSLSESTRQALLLKTQGDLSYAEIGAMLGLTEQAARVKVFRARQTVAELTGRSKEAHQ